MWNDIKVSKNETPGQERWTASYQPDRLTSKTKTLATAGTLLDRDIRVDVQVPRFWKSRAWKTAVLTNVVDANDDPTKPDYLVFSTNGIHFRKIGAWVLFAHGWDDQVLSPGMLVAAAGDSEYDKQVSIVDISGSTYVRGSNGVGNWIVSRPSEFQVKIEFNDFPSPDFTTAAYALMIVYGGEGDLVFRERYDDSALVNNARAFTQINEAPLVALYLPEGNNPTSTWQMAGMLHSFLDGYNWDVTLSEYDNQVYSGCYNIPGDFYSPGDVAYKVRHDSIPSPNIPDGILLYLTQKDLTPPQWRASTLQRVTGLGYAAWALPSGETEMPGAYVLWRARNASNIGSSERTLIAILHDASETLMWYYDSVDGRVKMRSMEDAGSISADIVNGNLRIADNDAYGLASNFADFHMMALYGGTGQLHFRDDREFTCDDVDGAVNAQFYIPYSAGDPPLTPPVMQMPLLYVVAAVEDLPVDASRKVAGVFTSVGFEIIGGAISFYTGNLQAESNSFSESYSGYTLEVSSPSGQTNGYFPYDVKYRIFYLMDDDLA